VVDAEPVIDGVSEADGVADADEPGAAETVMLAETERVGDCVIVPLRVCERVLVKELQTPRRWESPSGCCCD